MYAETSTQIIFYYPVTAVVDRLKLYSQYPVKVSGADESQFLTDDELELIYIEIHTAINRIFQVAVKLSKTIPDAVLNNTALAINGANAGLVFGFRLNNYHGYNPNVLPIVDSAIQAYWTNLVMISWFGITKNADLFKVETSKTQFLHVAYNNSLTELYKPKINSVMPEYTIGVTVVDNETGLELTDTVTTTPTTTEMSELVWKDTYADIIATDGVENLIYIDKENMNQYSWNGTAYVPYAVENKIFTASFADVNTVVCIHNLNKLKPNVKMTDADGKDWEVDYNATSVNEGIVSWNKNKTGTLELD